MLDDSLVCSILNDRMNMLLCVVKDLSMHAALTSLLSELLTNYYHSNDGENQFLKLIRKRKDLMLINYLVTILYNWYALYLIHSCWQF